MDRTPVSSTFLIEFFLPYVECLLQTSWKMCLGHCQRNVCNLEETINLYGKQKLISFHFMLLLILTKMLETKTKRKILDIDNGIGCHKNKKEKK